MNVSSGPSNRIHHFHLGQAKPVLKEAEAQRVGRCKQIPKAVAARRRQLQFLNHERYNAACEKIIFMTRSFTSKGESMNVFWKCLVLCSVLLSRVGASEYLDLDEKQLTETPDVSQNPELHTLHLGNNLLTHPPDVSHNPALQRLWLSDNQLTEAPDVSHNPALWLFTLANNQLTRAPILSQNPALEHLDLRGNQLTEAPDVSRNPELRGLYLDRNALTQAPDVSQNPLLEHLCLRGNQLTEAPELSQNSALKGLDLRENQLTELPDSIFSLSRECLVFASWNLLSPAYEIAFQERLGQHRESCPAQGPTIIGFPNLDAVLGRTVDFGHRGITETPDVTQCPALRVLRLEDNSLTQAPDVSQNPELQALTLGRNRLTVAPDVSHNPALRYLDLGFNKLTQAPELSQNPELRGLDLDRNALTQAPDVSHNYALVQLELSHNRLTQAPDVSQNPNLRDLDLSYNRLTELPDSILSLSNECTVSAGGNRFTAAYEEAFQRRLEQHRVNYPGQAPIVYFETFGEEFGEESDFRADALNVLHGFFRRWTSHR